MLTDDQKKEANDEIKKIVSHNHDPVDDAHHIYLQYYYAKKLRSRLQ